MNGKRQIVKFVKLNLLTLVKLISMAIYSQSMLVRNLTTYRTYIKESYNPEINRAPLQKSPSKKVLGI